MGLLLGICNAELTEAEVAEALVVNGPIDKNDRLKIERAGRWCTLLACAVAVPIPPNSTATKQELVFVNEYGGPLIVSKDRWTYSNPEGWKFFIYNNTGSVLLTGATAVLQAQHFGVWVT